MNQFLLTSNLILEIALAALLVLAYVIFKNTKKNATEVFFLLIILSSLFWAAANLITNLSTPLGDEVVLLWTKMTLIGPSLFALFLVFFANLFPENKYSLKPYIMYPLGACVGLLLILSHTSYNVESVRNVGQYYEFTPGPLYYLFAVTILFSIAYSTITLWKKYKIVGPEERGQIRSILVGILLSVLFGAILSVWLPLTGRPEFATVGSASVIFFIFGSSYAILKHKLLDIRLIVTEVATYAALIILAGEIFLSSSRVEIIFRVIFLIFALYGGRLLIRSTQLEISRREQIEKLAQERTVALKEVEERNKNLAALQKVSEIVLNENDMKVMAQKILDELPKQLDSCIGALLSIVRDGNLVAYAISSSPFTDRIHSLVGTDLEKYSYPIKKDFNLMHNAIVEHKAIDSENLSDFISPPIPKPVAFTLQKLVRSQHVEAFPLYASGEPFGVMMYVFTSGKQTIHSKNFEIAKSISDEMSLAIQRAQAFQKLKEANEYLAQMDKMKDEFISMASHELNTPLAAIEGYLSMILDEGMGKVDAKGREYLNRAYASSKRLAELILDLLNVSRIEQGRLKMKFSQVNLGELAESVIHELQIKADSKKIYLKLETDKTKLPLTWCDPDRIREVFVNLTGNALKFTEKGGVTLRIVPGADGKTIVGSVSDTGRGIAKEDQKKLFQKFSQVKREIDEHQGTGLGLYISKNFVDLHNGRLWVESDAGKGSTFSFELPVLDKAPVEVEGAILEKPINSPQIEQGNKDVPQIITDSAKVGSTEPSAPSKPAPNVPVAKQNPPAATGPAKAA